MTIKDFMGGDSFEERTIDELLSYTLSKLRELFDCTDEGSFFHFFKKDQKEHYVNVLKKPEAYMAVVTADFGFSEPEASNHYILLQNVGYNLAVAFEKTIDWEPEIKD